MNFEHGLSTTEDYFEWINKRHRIFMRRKNGLSKPWINDPILQQYKFTNVFRQLDRGTVALQKLLERSSMDNGLLLWTICWYRLFNLDVHANHFLTAPDSMCELFDYIRQYKGKIFTSAHMSRGVLGESKVDTFEKLLQQIWECKDDLTNECVHQSMEIMFNQFLNFYCIGKFIAYEIVCDLRFTRLLENATDRMTWVNIGPGCKRGLQRLGLPVNLASIIYLYSQAAIELDKHLQPYFLGKYPPFELREIEHTLCEFDKYERVRLGQGRPREKYDGV